VALFTSMGTWNNFMGPLIYLNDQRLYPLALGLFDFRTQHGAEDVRPRLLAEFLAQRQVVAAEGRHEPGMCLRQRQERGPEHLQPLGRGFQGCFLTPRRLQ